MITVSVSINGSALYTRSAQQVKALDDAPDGLREYRLDDGTRIRHRRGEGALALAKKMLDKIKELDK